MKITFRQKVLAWVFVALGSIIAYSGHLIIGLLACTVGIYVATVETDKTLFGDEEEPNDEEDEL